MTKHLPKVPPPHTITLGIRFKHMNLGGRGHEHSVYSDGIAQFQPGLLSHFDSCNTRVTHRPVLCKLLRTRRRRERRGQRKGAENGGEEERGMEVKEDGEEVAEKANAATFCYILNSSHILTSSAHIASQMLGLKICSMLI